MAKNKTQETTLDPIDFINSVSDEDRRKDSLRLVSIMKEESGYRPKMWGASIVGFCSYHYRYATGHEGDAPLVGFSPRKKAFSLYLYQNFQDKENYLKILGKHKAGVGCIYVNKLGDIDEEVLRKMITVSIEYLKKIYP